MPQDIRTLPPWSLRMLLALMASDTASPLTQAQRETLWRQLRKDEGQPVWAPTVDECGIPPSVLQQWFNRCNRDLRIYMNTPAAGPTAAREEG